MTMTQTAQSNYQLATFHLDDLWLGIDIEYVQEIIRKVEPAPVPEVDDSILGVIHIRGEVVTIIDLRELLKIGSSQLDDQGQYIIVDVHDERIGLLVDRVDDVRTVQVEQLSDVPPNLAMVGGEAFRKVLMTDEAILTLLDVELILT